MNLILVENEHLHQKLRPFTFLRPVAQIRVGILTLEERWQRRLGGSLSWVCRAHLQPHFPAHYQEMNVYLAAHVLATDALAEAVRSLKPNQVLVNTEGEAIAWLSAKHFTYQDWPISYADKELVRFEQPILALKEKWHIFQYCRQAIEDDFELLTRGRTSAPLHDPHTIVYGDRLFLEEGASIRASIINTDKGPVYIGKNAQVHEGSIISGAFALGEGAHLNEGCRMKGDTSIGPYCKVGGEVSNSVFFGYSNKGHDGFVGNSVIAEWCNLGADTNTSNLKNNYGEVKVWDYSSHRYAPSGQTFCGLLMGDHSKSSINSMFNTGTVVGVAANVFDSGFPPKFIPSFSWGGKQGFEVFELDKCFEVAERMMQRRKMGLTAANRQLLEEVMRLTVAFRA